MINSPHVPGAGVLFAVMLKKMASAVSVDKKEQDRQREISSFSDRGRPCVTNVYHHPSTFYANEL